MKSHVSFAVLLSTALSLSQALTISPVTSTSISPATITPSTTIDEEDIELVKRYRQAVVPNTKTSSSAPPPESWIRTISSTIVEIVHPTVIAGVTFSAKPVDLQGGPTPWVSLNKQGVPKTIKPKIKNGVTENKSPDYTTYFKTATTIVHDNKDLKAHNLGEEEQFKEVKWIPEDDTYVKLNPIIRCTPDRYFNKGIAKDISSEPFCTPADKSNFDLGKTYFITWFTRYFEDAEKVRIHLAYIKEKSKEKGMKKRELEEDFDGIDMDLFTKREDGYGASGTDMAFFTSDWIINRDGYFPLEVDKAWLKGQYSKDAIITIQPDTIEDEDFDLLTNGIIVKLRIAAAVGKKSKAQLQLEDEGGLQDGENKYIILMTMPTLVCIAACVMYFLTQLCSGDRDVASIRRKYYKSRFHKVLGKPKNLFKSKKSKKGYGKLPNYENEHELETYKQS